MKPYTLPTEIRQRIIIRDWHTADDMARRFDPGTRWNSHWQRVKMDLIHDYENISSMITWGRA